MPFSLPLSLREKTERIAQEILRPESEAVDQEARWPERGLRSLQAAGLAGLVAPTAAGGHGLGLMALAQTCEILGEACASTSMCFGMHSVGTAVLAAKASPGQLEEYLVPIAKGQHLTTLALSEPGTGAHFYFPETKIERTDSGDYEVMGQKSFVTNGSHADSYVVSTVAGDPNAPIGQFSCVVIPGQSEGLRWGETWDGFGMRGNSSRSVLLDRIRVPREHLLGKEGDQLWYVFEVIAPYFLIAMAGTYLGVAQDALKLGIEHLKSRRYSHSGSSLAQQTALQHKVGSLWAQVERTRQLVYSASAAGDAKRPDALCGILSAKAEAGDCAVSVVNDVMTLMGGSSYGHHSRLGRLLRDARAAHVMAPTTDILRIWTGRTLLGLPLLGE